jgi:amino acid transporter
MVALEGRKTKPFLLSGGEPMSTAGTLTADEQRLAELGYKQELKRGWSGFSNFAISFSIISVLAGCFTTYGQALKNGGTVAISIGWPLISIMILAVAFSMSEIASAFPTAGGIYYWALRLGGAGWGWFTGWFNLIGLVAVVASVDYVCATFLMNLLGLYNVHFIFNFSKAAAATDVHYSAHVNFA